MRTLSTTKDVIFHCLPHVGGRILDLGAGMTKYKPILMKRASEYIACDTKKNKDINIVCNAEHLIFATESFDTVILTQVFEHVANPFLVAEEVKRVLKTGGRAIVTAPFMFPYHADPEDYFRVSQKGLEDIFKSINFEIVESGIYGGFFMVFSEMIHFSWFNPYKNKSGRFFSMIEKIAKFFDKIIPSKIIYANSFVIAKKK